MHVSLSDHLEKLKYFVVIAEAQSVQKASRILRITQPTLSRSIQILESVLERKLFNRSVKGMTLTPTGTELLQFSRKLLRDTNQLERTLEGKISNLRNSIVIGTYASLATNLFIPAIRRIQKKHPVRIEFLVLRGNQVLIEKCLNHEIQLAVMAEAPHVKSLHRKKILTNPLRFYVSAKHELAHKNIKISDLENYPSIVYPDALLGQNSTLDAVLWEQKIVGGITYTANSFDFCRDWAMENMGFTILPRVVASLACKNKTLVELNVQGIPKDFGLSTLYALYGDANHSLIPLILENLMSV